MNRMMLLLLALSASFAGVNASSADSKPVETLVEDTSKPVETVVEGEGDAVRPPVATPKVYSEEEQGTAHGRIARWFRGRSAHNAYKTRKLAMSKHKVASPSVHTAGEWSAKEGVTATTSQALKYKRGKGKDGKDIVLNALPTYLTPEEVAAQDAARGFTVADTTVDESFEAGDKKTAGTYKGNVGKLTKATDRSKVRTMPTTEELVAGKAALKSLPVAVAVAAPAVAKPTYGQRIKGHWNTSEDGSFNKRHAVATGIDTVAGLGLGATIVWKKSMVNALFTRGLVNPTSRLGKLLLTPGFVEGMSVGLMIAIMESTGLMTGNKGPRGPITGLIRMAKNRNKTATTPVAAEAA
ncbi:MAG: hypothetical protein QG604_310 [Candidatus Dependentiae bacterium]|nr:hypothetical protein [Candidatus Dependentiae bacterium]